jgi:diguanylate cyclase (GGDEF)-like protein
VAHRLRRAVRADDLIGRYGGEEFLIVLNGCAGSRLVERAEKLREVISGESLLTEAGEVFFTVSIGAVAVERQDSNAGCESILNLADTALYQAKREGRNRVVIANGLIEEAMA